MLAWLNKQEPELISLGTMLISIIIGFFIRWCFTDEGKRFFTAIRILIAGLIAPELLEDGKARANILLAFEFAQNYAYLLPNSPDPWKWLQDWWEGDRMCTAQLQAYIEDQSDKFRDEQDLLPLSKVRFPIWTYIPWLNRFFLSRLKTRDGYKN